MNELFGGKGASMDFSWITDPSSYDPSYPFVAYAYIVAIAIVLRFFLVMRPLFRVYRKYSDAPMKEMLHNVDEILSKGQKKQLIGFILAEAFILIVPALAAFLTRIILREPQDFSWDSVTLFSGVVLAFLWLLIQFKQSIDMRDMLRILDKKRYHPKLINFGLSRVTSSRKKLQKMIQFEPDYIVRSDDEIQPYKTMIEKDEDGNYNFDMDAAKENLRELGTKGSTMAHNISEIAKSSAQKISNTTLEKIDKKIQETIDDKTHYSMKETITGKLTLLLISFGPLFVIYVLLPWLG
jgi:hypothetical protein|tara:strand:- start:349 stop:1233 length:885 start_codon:yes stop_codon:yes gene_type:complete